MPNYTTYKNLEKPLSIERYNVNVANKNNDVIDSELHELNLEDKRITQDLNKEIDRASASENAISKNLSEHTSDYSNPHKVTKAQVGLANVNNTSDIDKPVSTAQQNAIESAISNHDNSDSSHNDIRELIKDLISELTTRLNTLADCDDTTLDQLSEIVTYIKNNRSLIDSVTTSKVNVSDIIDNLTSTATNKPLSAKQGKVLNDLINALKIPTKISDLINDSEFLDTSGGEISNDDKSMLITPSGIKGDDGQSLTDFYKVEANSVHGRVLYYDDEDTDERYFPASGGFIDGSITVEDDVVVGGVLEAKEILDESGVIPISIKKKHDVDETELLIYGTGIYIKGHGDDGYNVNINLIKSLQEIEELQNKLNNHSDDYTISQLGSEYPTIWVNGEEKNNANYTFHYYGTSIDGNFLHCPANATGVWITNNTGRTVTFYVKCKAASNAYIQYGYGKPEGYLPNYQNSGANREYFVAARGTGKIESYLCAVPSGKNFFFGCANGDISWIGTDYLVNITASKAVKAEQDSEGNVIVDHYLPISGGTIDNDDDKSMNVTPSGIMGDGAQTLTDFYKIEGNIVSADTLLYQTEDTDERYLLTSGDNSMQNDLDMGQENIKNVGHIRGLSRQDIDFDGSDANFGIFNDIVNDYSSSIMCKNGGGMTLRLTKGSLLNIESIEINGEIYSLKNRVILSDDHFKVNVHNGIEMLASDDIEIKTSHFSLGSDDNSKRRYIKYDSAGNLELFGNEGLKIISNQQINLNSNADIRLEAPENFQVKTKDIKGIKLSNGNKPSITNFGNINCETLNKKIPKYNVALLADYTSIGRNLEDISWAQIKADVDAGNVSKYCVGDYKKFTTTDGNTFTARIAGINTYSGKRLNANLGYLGCHIDWISDEVGYMHTYRNTNTNNGIETDKNPFTCSTLCSYMHNTLIDYIPQEIRNVISDKYLDIDGRYSGSGALSASNYYMFCINLGKLWLPTEMEILGRECYGTARLSSGFGAQREYPLFRDFPRFTQKRKVSDPQTTVNMQSWWLMTAYNGNNTDYVSWDWTGHLGTSNAIGSLYIPICFRITSNNYN